MTVLKLLIAGIVLFFAQQVVFFENTVYSVLSLICVFFWAAVLCVVLRVEYFAFTMLIIYIGAVSILFLFVIMMLGSNVEKVLKFSMKINKRLYYLVVSQFGLVFGWYWFNISKISAFSWLVRNVETAPLFLYTQVSNDMLSVGILLYGLHYFLLMLAALVLLVAMVCSVVLSLSGLN